MVYLIVCLALCVISAATFIVLKVTKGGFYGLISKTTASLIFVVSGIIAITLMKNPPTYTYLFVVGLFFGMIGDVFLDLKELYPDQIKIHLNGGMLAFAIGHIFYFVALTLCANETVNTLIPFIISCVAGGAIAGLILINSGSLGVKFGNYKYQSIIYVAILCITMVYSIALAVLTKTMWLLSVGLVLFLVSDLILSLIYFAGKTTKKMYVANLSIYYTAQILIMSFLFYIVV